MLCKVTHCAGRVLANTRPYDDVIRWGATVKLKFCQYFLYPVWGKLPNLKTANISSYTVYYCRQQINSPHRTPLSHTQYTHSTVPQSDVHKYTWTDETNRPVVSESVVWMVPFWWDMMQQSWQTNSVSHSSTVECFHLGRGIVQVSKMKTQCYGRKISILILSESR